MSPASPDPADHALPSAPILALGLALPLAPSRLVDAVLAAVCAAARRRHPPLFERLRPLGRTTILIDPVDLPTRFLLGVDGERTTLRALARSESLEPPPKATVRGSLAALIDLLEGRVDGDALFFARKLAIEGDTTTIVTLRNAIEAEPLAAVEVLTAPLWPLDGAARRLALGALDLCRAAEARLATIRQVVEAPLLTRIETQEREMRRLAARLAELEGQGKRR
jgi:predicted lipid carrier protein YhbT